MVNPLNTSKGKKKKKTTIGQLNPKNHYHKKTQITNVKNTYNPL
jgi:hypothetical protein